MIQDRIDDRRERIIEHSTWPRATFLGITEDELRPSSKTAPSSKSPRPTAKPQRMFARS